MHPVYTNIQENAGQEEEEAQGDDDDDEEKGKVGK